MVPDNTRITVSLTTESQMDANLALDLFGKLLDGNKDSQQLPNTFGQKRAWWG